VPEQNDFPFGVREPLQTCVQALPGFQSHQSPVRPGLFPVGRSARPGFVAVQESFERGELPAAFCPPDVIASQIGRDPKEPRLEPAAMLVVADLADHAQERLLQQVLGGFARAGQPVQQPEDA